MQKIAKSVLAAIIVSICILIFINLAFFFPWYSTIVIETFSLSQVASNDNYIKETYYYSTLDNLKDRPIFRDKPDKVKILVQNSDGSRAIGYDDASYYEGLSDWEKPYRQRGETITITIEAVYPFTVTLWGEKYEIELPVSFSLRTAGLKHYKDLEFY